MRTFFITTMMILCTFGLLIQDASAKRFGGGRSIGVSRSHSSYSTPYKKPTASSAATGARANKWGGMLGGLLVGGLLASLFMGHGIGAGLLAWLGVGLLCLFIFSLLNRKMPAAQFQGATSSAGGPSSSFSPNFASGFTNMQDEELNLSKAMPDDEGFLREVKGLFIRLQTAYDAQNIEDIRLYTSPELLAEIQLQFHERDNAFNYTEVVKLDAELLDMSQDSSGKVASVRFSGAIKENGTLNEQFQEIWHFCKTGVADKWIVAGLQQM
jgi:predicted lipid-binding transport protein (Tim44 family)